MDRAFWFVILISIGVVLVTIFIFSKRRRARSGELNEAARASPQPGATSRYRGAQPKSADLPLSPPAAEDIDNNVQFTVYRPSTIVPQLWYTLVAFAHLSKARPNAPPNEPDPIKEVQRLAAKILSDQPARYEASKLDRGFSVPRKGLLTFVPLIAGCEFNPPTQSILWQKTVHKVEFEMMALPEVDGSEVEGQMTVYLGNIILTEVPLRISVDSHYVAPQSQPSETEEASAMPYRKIFASYSHQDIEIVEDFENYVRALGDTYLRDVQTLRAGEVWSEKLEEMIREASVFQLFWSSKSMPSKFVRQEWEYALSLNRPKFIRPVYWEEPLPETKPDLPPASLKRLHFYKFPGHEPEKSEGMLVPVAEKPKSRRHTGALMTVALASFFAVASIAYLRLNSGGNSGSPIPTPLNTPDVRIEVRPTNKLRVKGDSAAYSIVVTNRGPGKIINLELREHLPDELEYVSSDPRAVLKDSNTIVWTVDEIVEGPSATVPFSVTVKLRSTVKDKKSITTSQTLTYTDEEGNRRTIDLVNQTVRLE
jgi:uncharacterized repeat protein (TIGR01451 family)